MANVKYSPNKVVPIKGDVMAFIVKKLHAQLRDFLIDYKRDFAKVEEIINKDGMYYAETKHFVTVDGIEYDAKLRVEIIKA